MIRRPASLLKVTCQLGGSLLIIRYWYLFKVGICTDEDLDLVNRTMTSSHHYICTIAFQSQDLHGERLGSSNSHHDFHHYISTFVVLVQNQFTRTYRLCNLGVVDFVRASFQLLRVDDRHHTYFTSHRNLTSLTQHVTSVWL